nr:DNA helicase [Tanacetum cinerariifolium]
MQEAHIPVIIVAAKEVGLLCGRAQIDESINNGRGPYVFKISEQLYHSIGSLCPVEGAPPRFLHLYIYDTDKEVDNRMSHFGGDKNEFRRDIVEGLIDLLDAHNALVQLFRIACAIVYKTGPKSDMDYDIVLEKRSGYLQRVNKLHPSYMALQFPLLFIYGEDGYSKELKMVGVTGSSSEQKRVSMKAYYSYYLHDRYNYLSRTRRLFQQYVVTAFCAIEHNRIDYIREHQNDIKNEYLLGIYDAINQRDNDGSDCGSRLILPQSFTGGLRYIPYRRAEDIDIYISAELPPEDIDPKCYRIVSEFMMHGPCGLAYLPSMCTQNNTQCKKNFPKEYCNQTEPAVQILFVHFQNMQRIIFKERDHLDSIVVNAQNKITLTEWLYYNEHNTDGRHLTYLNFPSEFV